MPWIESNIKESDGPRTRKGIPMKRSGVLMLLSMLTYQRVCREMF